MAKPKRGRGRKAAIAPKSADRALTAAQLAKVRELCLSLPEVDERMSHGHSMFYVNEKRPFVYFLDNHHNDGRLALWCAAPDGAQAMLIDSNPDHYFLPPYVARLGWIGLRLDRKAAWNEIAMVIENAHQARYKPPRVRATAAKRTKRR